MAWRCRFMSTSTVPKNTQRVVHRVVVAGLADSPPDIPPNPSYSTGMASDGMIRRGAATVIMAQVGDALTALRVASVAGERST